jgi:hypothetical protein
MGIKIFHTPKNKQFNYKPRYWDERKENLENRIEQIKKDMGYTDNQGDKTYVPNIKGRIRGSMRRTQEDKQKSNFRLIFIFIILAILAYYFFIAK